MSNYHILTHARKSSSNASGIRTLGQHSYFFSAHSHLFPSSQCLLYTLHIHFQLLLLLASLYQTISSYFATRPHIIQAPTHACLRRQLFIPPSLPLNEKYFTAFIQLSYHTHHHFSLTPLMIKRWTLFYYSAHPSSPPKYKISFPSFSPSATALVPSHLLV